MAGFNPFDVLIAIYLILKQIKEGKAEVQNEYKRAVKEVGNLKAQQLMNEVFHVKSREWRGFPEIPDSFYEIRNKYSQFNARVKFDVHVENTTWCFTSRRM